MNLIKASNCIAIFDVLDQQRVGDGISFDVACSTFQVSILEASVRDFRVPLSVEIQQADFLSSNLNYELHSILSVDYGCVGVFCDNRPESSITLTVDDNLYPVYAAGEHGKVVAIRVVLHDSSQDLTQAYRIPRDLLRETPFDPGFASNLDYYEMDRIIHDAKSGKMIDAQEAILRQEIGRLFHSKDYSQVLELSTFLEGKLTGIDLKRMEIARRKCAEK